jgi:DNA invertase Pin-like site-specific DNA recombinase
MILAYRRCSQDDQQHGPKAQIDRIEAWRTNHARAPFQDFFDDGVSGSVPLAKRPEGAKLLAAAQPGCTIVVAKLDRLFRSVADAAITLDAWNKIGIKLVALAENFDMTNHFGRAMAQVASVFAELERAIIRERTRAALAAKRARGEVCGAVPFGWDAVDGKLVANASEQAALAQIKTWRLCGLTLKEIANRLNAAGVPAKRGGVWRKQSVRSVLKRTEG